VAALAVVAAAVGATLLVVRYAERTLWSRSGEATVSGLGREILVMRTPGGLLEVSNITATEQFDKKFIYTLVGLQVGETVAHIRVPATYRYHIELAPEWEVYRKGDVFTVITPPLKPTLPVAVNLAKMEKDVGGTWYLVPFNEQQDLDALEREITGALAQRAGTDAYLKLQRDAARKTVSEFVQKWLVTQQEWKAAESPRIEVVFGE
jgi:hypothetical protein